MSRIEVYRDEKGKYRWSFVSRNGRVLADSGQGYVRRIDCLNAASVVTDTWLPGMAPNFTEEINGQERQVWEVARP